MLTPSRNNGNSTCDRVAVTADEIHPQQHDREYGAGGDRLCPERHTKSSAHVIGLVLGNEPLTSSLGSVPCPFVIFSFEVDVPHVEIRTKDIPCGVNRRQHRMILIVVAMLTVATYEL